MTAKRTSKKKISTHKDIIRMIEKNGGPEGLDLSHRDLSGIDLGEEIMLRELARWRKMRPDQTPIWYSEYSEGINLQKTNLERSGLESANLSGADLRKSNLSWSNLQEASLDFAWLIEANLSGANLQHASLVGTRLWDADLSLAHLERTNLSASNGTIGMKWHGANLEQTKVPDWRFVAPIGEEIARDYYFAKDVYLGIKDIYNDLGHYDYAREAYIKEREMERLYHKQYKHWWPWLWLTLFRWSSTYGQNPVAVFLWTLGWVVLFAAIYAYFLAGGIRIAPEHWTEWWPVLYSMASFATLEFSGFEALSPWAKLATSIESLLGIFWLAYFVYALANRTRSF